jgi:sugar transferase (PEP-CTERM/EpsH1 system associated)
MTTGRVRVVHLVLALDVGGLEKVVLNLARLSAQDVFETRVLCLREPGALAPQLAALGVPVESLDCPDLPKGRTLWRLIRRLRALRPHVVHTHNPGPHLFGAVAARVTGVPVVIHTKHGRNQPGRARAVAWNRLASALSDCIVSVSEATAEVARRVERVPERKLRVIHNGIDLMAFPARPQSGGGAAPAIHVARLQRIKDQPTLLKAVRLVVDAEPGFRLDIVGDGPARAELQALAKELELTGHVRFLGARDDVSRLLSSASLFVLSSLSEGVPLTLLEAMATGLPAVVTDVGGNREIVVPGETGLLVPPGSPPALAEAIRTLWTDPERAGRLGAAGRRRVEEKFDMRRVAARYESLYRELLDRKR